MPCQHIRGNAFATLESQEDTHFLAVKQYTPLDNLRPKSGDLTIIGAHANAFPKVFTTRGGRCFVADVIGTLRTAVGRIDTSA